MGKAQQLVHVIFHWLGHAARKFILSTKRHDALPQVDGLGYDSESDIGDVPPRGAGGYHERAGMRGQC